MGLFISSCATVRPPASEGEYRFIEADADTIVSGIPDYRQSLHSLKGKGRAIVSEPGNSDRVTITFESDREVSVLTFQNRIGIEGGQMRVDQDSVLIYNRVDKYAQKISVYDGYLTTLNELASINIVDLMNYQVESGSVERVLEGNNIYQLRLKDGARVYVNKGSGLVEQVIQTRPGQAPYSSLRYESYGELNGFLLPRKITILSADGRSRVVFVVRSLEVNPDSLKLELELPDNMVIERL